MKRRILAFLLATTMACSLFTACGGNDVILETEEGTQIDESDSSSNENTESTIQLDKVKVCVSYRNENHMIGSKEEEKYEYVLYENGLIKEKKKTVYDLETEAPPITSVDKYEYDAKGNLIKEMWCYSDDTIIQDMKYDEHNNLIYHSKYKEYPDGTEVEMIEETTYTYEYDENNNILKKTQTFMSGGKEVYIYTYDENGNIASQVNETYSEEGLDWARERKYEYDENNRMIKEVSSEENGYRVYTYNEYGDLEEVAFYNKEDEYSSCLQRYEYTYTADGKIDTYKCYGGVEGSYELYDADGNILESKGYFDGKFTSEEYYEYEIIEVK